MRSYHDKNETMVAIKFYGGLHYLRIRDWFRVRLKMLNVANQFDFDLDSNSFMQFQC